MLMIGITTIVSWIGLGVVLLNTNPEDDGLGSLTIFYLTLFAGLVGVLTLLGVAFRVYVAGRKDVVQREVRVAFRHAVLLSLTGVVALLFSAQGFFRWWVLVLILFVVTVIEYLFLLKESSRRR